MESSDKNIEDKIRALLRQGSEHEKLDYKTKLDISNTGSCVEIIKDIGAMLSSEGGTILVGANSLGQPVTDFTETMLSAFDEAKFRVKIKKYIAEPISILTTSAKIDGFNHLLIECGEYPNGFVIFKADGQYVDEKGRQKEAFRKGDVYVRHGSASERWEQHDVERIINSQVSQRKLEWLKDVDLIMSRSGMQPTQTKSEEAKRLKAISKDLKSKTSKNELNISDIKILLDEVCLTMLNAIDDEQEVMFEDSLKIIHQVYGLGFDYKGSWRLDRNFKPEDLWHEVLIRLPIIGGFCIENKKYLWAKKLALQKVPGDDGRHYNNWYRHAFTMSSRSNKFSSDHHRRSSLIETAVSLATTDQRYRKLLEWDEEQALTECTQFDYLAATLALDDAQEIDTSCFYPSFSFHGKHRVTQLLVDVVLDQDTRNSLFKSSDENLAYILKQMDLYAANENFSHWSRHSWAYGLRDFIAKAVPFENTNEDLPG